MSEFHQMPPGLHQASNPAHPPQNLVNFYNAVRAGFPPMCAQPNYFPAYPPSFLGPPQAHLAPLPVESQNLQLGAASRTKALPAHQPQLSQPHNLQPPRSKAQPAHSSVQHPQPLINRTMEPCRKIPSPPKGPPPPRTSMHHGPTENHQSLQVCKDLSTKRPPAEPLQPPPREASIPKIDSIDKNLPLEPLVLQPPSAEDEELMKAYPIYQRVENDQDEDSDASSTEDHKKEKDTGKQKATKDENEEEKEDDDEEEEEEEEDEELEEKEVKDKDDDDDDDEDDDEDDDDDDEDSDDDEVIVGGGKVKLEDKEKYIEMKRQQILQYDSLLLAPDSDDEVIGRKLRKRKRIMKRPKLKISRERSPEIELVKCKRCKKYMAPEGETNRVASAGDGYCVYCSKSKVMSHEQRQYYIRNSMCYLCDKQFTRPRNVRRHLRDVHREPVRHLLDVVPYKCSNCFEQPCSLSKVLICCICKKKLSSAKTLRNHHRAVHSANPLERECPHCDKVLTSEYGMILHIRSIHKGIRPFKCNYCGKDFVTGSALQVHVRIHTGEKPYTCTGCGKAYSDRSNLRHHQKRACRLTY